MYADVAWFLGNLDLRSLSGGGYDADDYPLLKEWLEKISARERWKAVLKKLKLK
jgi:hypothetical protein